MSPSTAAIRSRCACVRRREIVAPAASCVGELGRGQRGSSVGSLLLPQDRGTRNRAPPAPGRRTAPARGSGRPRRRPRGRRWSGAAGGRWAARRRRPRPGSRRRRRGSPTAGARGGRARPRSGRSGRGRPGARPRHGRALRACAQAYSCAHRCRSPVAKGGHGPASVTCAASGTNPRSSATSRCTWRSPSTWSTRCARRNRTCSTTSGEADQADADGGRGRPRPLFAQDLLGQGVAGLSTADMRKLPRVRRRPADASGSACRKSTGSANPLAFMELQDVQAVESSSARCRPYQVGVQRRGRIRRESPDPAAGQLVMKRPQEPDTRGR